MGVSSLDVDEAGVDTFGKLVQYLVKRYPDTSFHLLDEDGQLRPDVPVYVDGRNPRLKDGMDAPLSDQAVISFFSPIASGRMNVEALRTPNL